MKPIATKWEYIKIADAFLEVKNGKTVNQIEEVGKYKVSRIEIIATASFDANAVKSQIHLTNGIPVYSANVFQPFGYINKELIKDFSQSSVLWGIDGDWMVNSIPANMPFYPTDHCGVLRIKNDELHYKYVAWALNKIGTEMRFSRNFRASIDRIEGIYIPVPPLSTQETLVSEIEKLELQITENQAVILGAKAQKEEVLKKYLHKTNKKMKTIKYLIYSCLAIFLLNSQVAVGQYVQEAKLTGTGINAYSGTNSVSHDGKIVCLGGVLFKKTGCNWAEILNQGGGATTQTAMTATASVIVIDGTIYRRVGMTDVWNIDVGVVGSPSTSPYDISNDGNTIINGNNIYEYDVINFTWNLTYTIPSNVGLCAVYSCSISGDGLVAIVGTPCIGGGKTQIARKVAGVWTHEGTVTSSTPNRSDFGYTAGISDNGTTIVVGDPLEGNGTAFIFRQVAGIWTEQFKLLPINNATNASWIGNAVSISADGNKVIAATPTHTGQKIAWIVEWNGTSWQETSKVTLNCSEVVGVGALLGETAFISGDASTIGLSLFNAKDGMGGSETATFIFSTSGCVTGVPIYVRQDGNDINNGLTNSVGGAKATLQAAINSATDGQVIHIVNANGSTYNEEVTINKDVLIDATNNPVVKSITVSGTGCIGGISLTFLGNVGIQNILKADTDAFIATNGKVTLLASATQQAMIAQEPTGVVTGNLKVQRHLRPNTGTTGLGYRFISSPTNDATFAQISELSPVVNAAFNTSATPGRVSPFPTLYSYDATKAGDPAKTFASSPFPEFDKGWVSPTALTEAITAGKGYTVNTVANQVVEISGLPNNGDVTIPVITGNAASLGYNLVGNPYPSPISWTAVRGLSTGLQDAIYQNMATGQYSGSWASFVGGVGVNGATDDIAVMQGFFVIANAAGNVNFDNTVRATTYKNPSSFRTETDQSNKGLVRLAMTNSANKTDETVVYFKDEATQTFDSQHDAYKFQLNGGNFSNIYTTDKIANTNANANEKATLYAINALPTLTDDLIVPVTLQAWTDGQQKIAMTEKLNFDREVKVFLKDKTTNLLHDFGTGAYTTNLAKGVTAGRYELVFQPQFTAAELSKGIVNVYPNPTENQLNFSLSDDYKGLVTIKLTDVAGREVWTNSLQKDKTTLQTAINLVNLPTGLYILTAQGKNAVSQKVVKQ